MTRPAERTGRAIALAIAFFGGFAAIGYADGVFARLEPATLLALGAFVVAFAALTCALDVEVRAALKRAWPGRAAPTSALAKSPGRKPAAT